MFLSVALGLLSGLGGCKKPAPVPEGTPSQGTSSAANSPGASATPGDGAAAPTAGQPAAGSLAARLQAVESGEADKPQPLALPQWKPWVEGTVAPKIPMVKGLAMRSVDASKEPQKDEPGDKEMGAAISEVTATQVKISKFREKKGPKGADGKQQKSSELACEVTVDTADLMKTHNFRPYVCESAREHYPDTEPFGVSTEVLAQLKAGQPAEFHFTPDSEMTGSMQAMAQMMGTKTELPPLSTHGNLPMFSCTLHRVGTTDVAFPVLLNDDAVELPALHASCSFPGNEDANLYFLDEADNPVALWFYMGILPEINQMIHIVVPSPEEQKAAGGSAMEQALAAKKPVEIYGIYFDFNSATIRPESEPVLKQISDIMHKNPDWKLNVSGHTDNIGDDPSNLELSKRRAAAVKDALVTQYKIAPERLATNGYGASRPVQDNKTIEGRARNRRVELQRQ